ncbi:MAG: polyprenyl diphosphate synthase [Acidobacteriota bacterium]|nr:polyprenyl diphosphate synthase [Acidobacteriota bacterium]
MPEGDPAADAPETATVLARIDRTRLPHHVAAIMDGNGRWAAARGLSRIDGHAAGVESVRDTVKGAARLGLTALTVFAFSSENWSRPRGEVAALMDLVKRYLRLETDNLVANDIRFRPIGRLSGLPPDLEVMLGRTASATRGCRGLTLSVALNYGGRAEIVDAARRIAARAARERKAPDLDETGFGEYLTTRGLPDPDLLIRTSGERRISNFLLFQTAYAEFWTTLTLWPDFRRRHLYEAILAYQRRDRRYGGLG